MDATRTLVLGSNAFSGAHCAAHLLRAGHQVLGISRSPEPPLPFLPRLWSSGLCDRWTFRQLDLNDDLDEISRTIDAFQPHAVVNFAAQSMVAQSWQKPDDWYRTNVLAVVRLCEHLRKAPYLRRYVHVSTPEVYGSFTGSLAENRSYHPSTPYATSRAAADMHLDNLHRNFGFPVVFTRAANVYGPGQQLYRIIPRTVLSILTGRRLPLDGGGWSIRSFIHIDDVCTATLAALERATPPAIYHLATARTIAIRDLVRLICTRMEADFHALCEIREDRPGKDLAYVLDSARAREELGWRDEHTLEDGIDQTVRWAREHLSTLRDLPWDYVHKA